MLKLDAQFILENSFSIRGVSTRFDTRWVLYGETLKLTTNSNLTQFYDILFSGWTVNDRIDIGASFMILF